MSRDWKPGDVAVGRLSQYAGRFIFRGEYDGWDEIDGEDGGWDGAFIEGLRPLIFIDPEEIALPTETGEGGDTLSEIAQCLRRLAEADPVSSYRRRVAERLAEVFDPTPPKPEEPTGLGAVVEDVMGNRWVLYTSPDSTAPWCDGSTSCEWDEIAAVRVLSEGVQP